MMFSSRCGRSLHSVLKQTSPHRRCMTNERRGVCVLGIETSCDDTACAVVDSNSRILAEQKFNQWSIHKRLGGAKVAFNSFAGGIKPELARRLHAQNLIWSVSDCIEQMGDDAWKRIDAIALTVKPGLEPCLWEGVKFTRLLLRKHKLPFIPIHHMEAHALTCRMFDSVPYPYLTLLISGGHCLLALVKGFDDFSRLGETVDISPGVCFDKIARELGLLALSDKSDSRSGGALLEEYAKNGDPNRFKQLIITPTHIYCRRNRTCDFSFTGIYAATHRVINSTISVQENTANVVLNDGVERTILRRDLIGDICASVQHAIALQLADRLERALKFVQNQSLNLNHIVVSGGVASNVYIRNHLERVASTHNVKLSAPPIKYCTDNGVMIAWNGVEKLLHKSADIVPPCHQDEQFFNHLKPVGKCELGRDIAYQVKLLDIKNEIRKSIK